MKIILEWDEIHDAMVVLANQKTEFNHDFKEDDCKFEAIVGNDGELESLEFVCKK